MIHYHGTPITPETAAAATLSGGHAFISFADSRNLSLAMDVCQSFAVDNGAFGAWTRGKPITDWTPYYDWIAELHRYPSFDFAVIPDVIDGDESDNDALLSAWPWCEASPHIGAPVWHLHESIKRLQWLAAVWPRICIGSSGEFAKLKTQAWWNRMAETFNAICDKAGRPICKVHGLRMLDPEVFSRFPFASADSTNIARNIGIDSAWKGTYTPPTKEARAAVMRARIESVNSPIFWNQAPEQIAIGF